MNNSKKIKLMYDGTLLANMYSTSNSDRTGVFFVVYNVFLKIVENSEFETIVYSEAWAKDAVEKAVRDLGFPDIRVTTLEFGDSLDNVDAFLASFAPPPRTLEERDDIKKYMILYDVTPLALPDIEKPNQEWFDKLQHSLNSRDYYFCISEYTKKDFLQFYPALDSSKMTITYLAASDTFYHCKDKDLIESVKRKYGIPVGIPYAFSLCTLQPRKNLVHAMKCFVQFLEEEKISDLIFVLGGGHWEIFIEELSREIDSFGKYKNRIIRAGYIEDQDLAPLYSGATFSVYMSLYEGFGLPALEALQCGCPLIASSTTSLPEVVGSAGILVDPKDPVALRKAYRKMYLDETFRDSCRQRGIERARGFSWDKCATKIADVIRKTYNLKPELEAGEHIETKEKQRKCFLGKVWTRDLTTFYFLGIPIARKHKSSDASVLKIFGVPVLRTKADYYVVRTYLGFLPVKVKPNYPYIDSQVELYVTSFNNAVCQLSSRLKKIGVGENESAVERNARQSIEDLRSYKLIEEVEDGHITLEDELYAVSKMMKND